ncbi:hypothetical protein QLQ12_41745 [Actinoplanes sp. NEAU-A12]|uniref:Secreted protein n=1 Tax=Actinoplanes sandaracinus TaxID=3045177 RepID=A0ABT6WZG2_9ACTN|nr:hypothetical protein [Actinoplanes sandaracinus]MDI6105128.1 hypothetical protein [Actinoplanes sandaracinus]
MTVKVKVLTFAIVVGLSMTSAATAASAGPATPSLPPSVSSPGRAQPPTPAGAAAFTVAQTCDAVQATLGSLAAAGKKSAACIERNTKPSTKTKEAIRRAKLDAIGPEWCQTLPLNDYYMNRQYICGITDWFYQVFDVRTGQIIGTMQFLVFDVTTTVNVSSAWSQQLEVVPYSILNAAVGTVITPDSARCQGNCFTSTWTLPPTVLSVGRDVESNAIFQTNISSVGSTDRERPTTSFILTSPGATPAPPLVLQPDVVAYGGSSRLR